MPSVVTTPQADDDIQRVDRWWRENRQAAPDLFVEELAEAFGLLAAAPELGHRYRSRRVAGVRRILLRATRYHVYFLVEAERVVVLTVWSAVRRRGPTLPDLGEVHDG